MVRFGLSPGPLRNGKQTPTHIGRGFAWPRALLNDRLGISDKGRDMTTFEYVVVPAPKRAPKVKGAKTGEARFAHALTGVMNDYGAEGWEYLRSDTLPCEERSGFTGTKTVFQTMLVFRRAIEPEASNFGLPAHDGVETPEQLAATLPAPAALAPPEKRVAIEPHLPEPRHEAAPALPRLGSARPTAPAVAGEAHVPPFPASAPDRAEERGQD